LQLGPTLFLVSQAAPQAVQFVGVFSAPQSAPPSDPASGRMAASPPLCSSSPDPSPVASVVSPVSPTLWSAAASPASPIGTLWSMPVSTLALASQSPPLQSPLENASSPPI
jgi:hypothetical protein